MASRRADSAALAPNASSAPTCLSCHGGDSEVWTEATDVEYCTTAEKFRYLHCKGCGVLFIDPVPRDRLSTIYPANYYSFKAQGASLVMRVKEWLDGRVFRRLLQKLPGDALSVLDVGGGAGWQLNLLRGLDARVRYTQVVDLDPNAEGTARANGHDYFLGRIEDFETERKFDFILMLNLIEHVEDPGAVLAKMGGLLNPGGALLIKTPNYVSLDERLFRGSSWAGYHCPRHWVLFTQESLRALVEKAGLSVLDFAYTQGAPFWSASVLCWLARRGILRVSADRPAIYHPLFGPLSALFAAFDLVRRPFFKTSQMFLTVGRR